MILVSGSEWNNGEYTVQNISKNNGGTIFLKLDNRLKESKNPNRDSFLNHLDGLKLMLVLQNLQMVQRIKIIKGMIGFLQRVLFGNELLLFHM